MDTQKTKENIVAELIKNPVYDSDWVNIAADLLSTTHIDEDGDNSVFTEGELAKLTAKQLSVVSDAVTTNKNIRNEYQNDYRLIPIKRLISSELNATQMELLKVAYSKAAEAKIPECDYELISALFNKDMQYIKISYLLMGIVEGFSDIVSYVNYDAAQIVEIYSGWKDGIDYRIYTSKEVDSDTMSIIRHALVLEKKVTMNDNHTFTIAY